MTHNRRKKSSPGNKLWLKPYKIPRGTAHINIDAIKNLFTTPNIAPPTYKELKSHNVMVYLGIIIVWKGTQYYQASTLDHVRIEMIIVHKRDCRSRMRERGRQIILKYIEMMTAKIHCLWSRESLFLLKWW